MTLGKNDYEFKCQFIIRIWIVGRLGTGRKIVLKRGNRYI